MHFSIPIIYQHKREFHRANILHKLISFIILIVSYSRGSSERQIIPLLQTLPWFLNQRVISCIFSCLSFSLISFSLLITSPFIFTKLINLLRECVQRLCERYSGKDQLICDSLDYFWLLTLSFLGIPSVTAYVPISGRWKSSFLINDLFLILAQ